MSQRRAKKVLLLDTDQKFRETLARKLSRVGFKLDCRDSLFELGSVGCLGSYDLIVADLAASPVTGLEVAEYAATFFPELPVVLVGKQPPDCSRWSWPPSVVACLRKSGNVDQVIAAIAKFFQAWPVHAPYSMQTEQFRYVSA